MESKIILLKTETVENTDAVPEAANAMEVIDPKIERYGGNTVERGLERQRNGNQEQVNTSPLVEIGFKVEAAGSGDAVTPAAYDPALLACGLDRTVDTTNNKVIYTPSTGDQDTVTIYDFDPEVGVHQKSTGVRGNVKIAAGKGQIPKIEFLGMKGGFHDPVPGTPPTNINWDAWKEAGAFVSSNVPVFTLDGFDIAPEQFDIDWGNVIPWIDVPNFKSSRIVDRNPTASLTAYAPNISEKNYWEKLKSHSGAVIIPMGFQLGTVAGNIIEVSCSMQLTGISEGESDNQRTYSMNANIISGLELVTR